MLLLPLTLILALQAVQPGPDFAGRWVIVSPARGAGQEQVVAIDGKVLSVTSADGKRKQTYLLDGSERRTTVPMRGGDIVTTSRAQWEGRTIVITTTEVYPNKMTTASKEVWSLDEQGRLVIEFTETAPGQPARSFMVIHVRR